jgi:hypothetical protein
MGQNKSQQSADQNEANYGSNMIVANYEPKI